MPSREHVILGEDPQPQEFLMETWVDFVIEALPRGPHDTNKRSVAIHTDQECKQRECEESKPSTVHAV